MNGFINKLKERKQELFDLLCELIRIDTQDFMHSGLEKNAEEYLCAQIRALGVEPDVYSPMDIPGFRDHPDFFDGRGVEDRINVSCVIPGSDHSRRLMLCGHIDTMPIGDLANWTVEPQKGIIRDGKIWGRGACDDKYALATILFLLRVLHDEKIVLPYDVVFTAYCDEEMGGGNGALAACLRYPCDDILNLDCKNFEIWHTASGGGMFNLYIKADEGKDSAGDMLPGLVAMSEVMDDFRKRREAELNSHENYRGTIIPSTSMRFTEIRAGSGGMDLDTAFAEVTFYTDKGEKEWREEIETVVKPALNEKLKPLGLHFDRAVMTTRFFHFMEGDEHNSAIQILSRAAQKVSGRKVEPKASCLSDLSLLMKYGSPRAISFGVGRDFFLYGGAHRPDEFIECDILEEFAAVVGGFLMEYR